MLALAAVFSLHKPAGVQTASLDLLRRATNPNPTLNSYTASAQLSATTCNARPSRTTLELAVATTPAG
jgi:hypothetical protein